MRNSIFLSAFLGAMTVFSAPTYYTFTGKVNFVPQDQGGYAAAHGIAHGSAVTYVFKVDTSLNGYTLTKGVKDTNTDIPDAGTGRSTNYFFDTLIVPSLFSAAIHDRTSGSYFGYSNQLNSHVTSAIQTIIGNANHNTQVIIYLPDTTINFLPHLGDSVQSTEGFSDSSTASSSVTMTLVVTGISNTPPASIGNRFPTLTAQPWVWAGLQGGSLWVQNHSGHNAEVRILNASGTTTQSLLCGESVSLPMSGLPQGIFVLRVGAAGEYGSLRQVFRH